MSTTTPTDADLDGSVVALAEDILEAHRETIGAVAAGDADALELEWPTIYRVDHALAEDLLDKPGDILKYFRAAAEGWDLPTDTDRLANAPIRIADLPDEEVLYPSDITPDEHAGKLVGVTGEIERITDPFAVMREAAFRCQRCETLTRIPQPQGADRLQEPHQCRGCDRDGPFGIDKQQSDIIDHQLARIKTPPDAPDSSMSHIPVHLDGGLTDRIDAGDRATIVGRLRLEQHKDENRFDPVLDANNIEIQRSSVEDMDISPAERERIEALANGAEGDPLEVAAKSYAPKIRGYHHIKRALILGLVGGERVEYDSDEADRGAFHILLIGDPSTGKSKLVRRADTIGWNAIPVSGSGTTQAGVTAAAVKDSWGHGETWTIKSGAAVEANHGALVVDELDDMDPQVRQGLLEPMSSQEINVQKGGEDARLQARCSVLAASNPKHGRFDPYEPIGEQIDFTPQFLERFDLIFTFRDEPDPEADRELAEHILAYRDVGGEPPIDEELLRKWIGLAKQQTGLSFASDEVREFLRDSYADLRAMSAPEDGRIAITARGLEAMIRLAEATARFHLSDKITLTHAKEAKDLFGRYLRDVGQDPETGKFDADVVETGTSASQRQRIQTLTDLIDEMEPEYDSGVPVDAIVDRADEVGLDPDKVDAEIEKLKHSGELYEPSTDKVRTT